MPAQNKNMKNQLKAILITGGLFLGSIQVHAQAGMPQPVEKTRRFLVRYMEIMDTTAEAQKGNILKGIEMVAKASMQDWISQYQASFYNATLGVNHSDSVISNQMLNQADNYIKTAESLKKDESEIVLLSAMIKGMRIKRDPSLGAKLGPEVMREYARAKKLNENNPRPWLVLGESYMYMTEEMGGGTKKAKEYLQTALTKFATDKHEDPAWPRWGEERTRALLKELEKK